MVNMSDVVEVKKTFETFATKPASIIHMGIVILLLISEWRNPTDLLGIVYKIAIMIISFVIVTIFNSQYFKHYWKNYNK